MTIHADVLNAAKVLAVRTANGLFKPKEIVDCLISEGKLHNPRSIQAELQRGCVNGSENWVTMYPYYVRVKKGVYKLA